jgi:signal transduction histidine kinase
VLNAGADRRLAVVAHELRRPLAPIASGVTLLRRRGADVDVRGLAGMMDRQVRDLARLVQDLADEQPADAFDFSVRLQHVDLVRAVQEAVQVVLPLVAARRHRVVSSIEAGPLPVCADPLRLRQIVVNLLENAAKYTPVNGRLEVDVRRDGGHAVLQVRDSGLGIAPERLPWIFDDKPRDGTRTAGGGLGVGLPLVQRLVGRHGGTVLAESDGPGRGSRFTVRLPLVGECPATTGSAGAAVGAPR